MTIADEVWIALAHLHRSQPERESFTESEIKERVRAEHIHEEYRTGVQWHVNLHMVANLKPNPAKLRMIYKLPDGTVRLFRPGDDSHPLRTGRMHPRPEGLPERYADLLDWYRNEYCKSASRSLRPAEDPVLAMKGVGKAVWAGMDVDEFIRDLRRDPPEPRPSRSEPRDVLGGKASRLSY